MSVRDGKFESFYADGSRHSTGEYKDDDSIGVWQEWYMNGGKKFEKRFDESGKPNGASITWMPNGDTSEIHTYGETGQLNGRRVSFWPGTGEMREQGEYKNGERNGLWTRWYRNGQPEWEREYDKGRSVGRWTSYSYFGQVTSSHEYLRDLPVELASSWGGALVEGVPTGKSLEFQHKNLNVDTVAIEERRFGTLMKIGEDWVVPFTWYSPRYPTYYKLKRDTLFILRHSAVSSR